MTPEMYRFFESLEFEKFDLHHLSSHLPCMVHVHRASDFRLTYLDLQSQARLNVKPNEQGEYPTLEHIMHPEDLPRADKLCREYVQNLDRYSLLSFIQRIKPIGEESYQTIYTTSKYIEGMKSLLSFSLPLCAIELTETSVHNILDETDFILQHVHHFCKLSQRDIQLVQHWVRGLKNPTLAELMSVTQQSIKSYKKRIYRKLGIHQFSELYRYAKAFELLEKEELQSIDEPHVNPADGIAQHSSEDTGHWHFEFSQPRYPGFIHVHRISDFSIAYLNETSYKELGLTQKEVQEMAGAFFHTVHHPSDHKRCIRLLSDFVERGDETDILTYFQRIRVATHEGPAHRIIITSAKLDLKNQVIVCISNTTDQMPLFTQKVWTALSKRMDARHRVQLFLRLSKREKELLPFLIQGKTAKEIAKLLFISPRTVEQHKKNIYKKLQVTSLQELISLHLESLLQNNA